MSKSAYSSPGKLFPDIREVKYKINQDIEILKKFIFDKLANFALRYNLAQQKLISRGIQYQNGKLINFERLSSKISKQALVSNIRNKKLKQNNLNEKIIRLLEQKLNNYAIKQEKINSELLSSTKGGIRDKSYLLSSNNRLLDSLNYKKTLNRGYAIIKDQDKSIIESKKVANQHKLVNIMFSDGEITVRNQNDK